MNTGHGVGESGIKKRERERICRRVHFSSRAFFKFIPFLRSSKIGILVSVKSGFWYNCVNIGLLEYEIVKIRDHSVEKSSTIDFKTGRFDAQQLPPNHRAIVHLNGRIFGRKSRF